MHTFTVFIAVPGHLNFSCRHRKTLIEMEDLGVEIFISLWANFSIVFDKQVLVFRRQNQFPFKNPGDTNTQPLMFGHVYAIMC